MARKVIVIGKFGIGKTSLINQVTKSELETSNNLFECTTKVQYATIHGITFIDTPGFKTNKNEDICKHLSAIALIMTKGVNGFLLCIESCRLSEVSIKLINCMKDNFPDFYNRTILIITKSDNIWEKEDQKTWLERQKKHLNYLSNFKFIKFFCGNNDKLKYLDFLKKINHHGQIEELISSIKELPPNVLHSKELDELKRAMQTENHEEINARIEKVYDKNEWWITVVSGFSLVSLIILMTVLKLGI